MPNIGTSVYQPPTTSAYEVFKDSLRTDNPPVRDIASAGRLLRITRIDGAERVFVASGGGGDLVQAAESRAVMVLEVPKVRKAGRFPS
jgi:hypothetical protein